MSTAPPPARPGQAPGSRAAVTQTASGHLRFDFVIAFPVFIRDECSILPVTETSHVSNTKKKHLSKSRSPIAPYLSQKKDLTQIEF